MLQLYSQVYSSSSLYTYHPCYLLCRVVGNLQVYHTVQIIKDLLSQMIIFRLSILVLHIPMIYAWPDQTDRFHRGLLWKKSLYPIQKYIFVVKRGEAKLLSDWKVSYHCEAKNATRLHTILACKTNWTLRLYICCKLCLIPNQHNRCMIICNWFDWPPFCNGHS